jgi:RsiW-degrading membrane proteinase PrsW (M82 family)
MNSTRKILLPLIILFVVVNGFCIASKNLLSGWGIDRDFILIANTLFFLINLMAFFMQKKALKNTNPNVFIRSIMGGMMIKMAICITTVMIYVLVWKDSFSKASVFAAMVLYLFYLVVEVRVATKLNYQKNA